jgi:hypothetical protein
VNKPACEYRNAHLPDYAYEADLAPFNVFSGLHRRPRGIHLALAYLMFRTSSSLRDPLSLRDWIVSVQIRIRAGRVETVGAELYLEGRTRWLGNAWTLSEDMQTPISGRKPTRSREPS